MNTLLTELQALEAELHHPGIRSNRERLEVLLHPEFHEVGSSGLQYKRETVIEHLTSQGEQPVIFASDYSVHQLTEACALLTYKSLHRASGGTVTRTTLRSSIWIRMIAGWQLYYHQGTVQLLDDLE